MKEKLTGNFYEQFPKMAKKALTGPGLEPETSGLTYQRAPQEIGRTLKISKVRSSLRLKSWSQKLLPFDSYFYNV